MSITERVEDLRVKFICEMGIEPNVLILGWMSRIDLEGAYPGPPISELTRMKVIDNEDRDDYLSVGYEITDNQPEESNDNSELQRLTES